MSRPWPKRVSVDFEHGHVTVEAEGAPRTLPLSSPDAFEAVAAAYLRCGWDAKYVYSFSWLGRPIIQLPDDAFRMQEIIFAVKPDVIVETGLAHGGSAVFYASLCKLMGRGRVIGVEVELRPHNRAALDAHPLRPLITVVDGSSIDPATVAQVRGLIAPGETVLVLLDSKHTKDHVLAELAAYAPLVTKGSYIVAMDGIMQHLTGAPRSAPDWAENNPAAAAREFAAASRQFELVEPPPPFNEGAVNSRVSYCPDAFLKRIT
ncbi:MAG: class I SAM-dependent methyltransferase [Alphaproteobacteria bacterium]|nr:class I SAM-dependent methyltransferase [Alphaproteobacteria bacterium]